MDDTQLFKTVFAAQIRAIEPSEDDLQEAKASLTDLRNLLPTDLNPEDDPDLLYVAGNLAVAGMVNLNDDGLDIPTALAVYKKFEKKQVNIEHNRHNIVGYIVRTGLSEYGTDRIITEDEARASGKPFNITTVAVLWRVAAKELCKYLVEASNPLHPDYKSLSLSFEMGFSDYKIVSLPKGEVEIAKATEIVESSHPEFEDYSKGLRAYGGKGFNPKTNDSRLYRVMPDTVIPLGQGIVAVPAAAVKGLIAVTQSPHQTQPAEDAEANRKKAEAEALTKEYNNLKQTLMNLVDSLSKKASASIISTKTSVLQSIEKVINLSNNSMNNPELLKIKEQVEKAEKPEQFKEAFANVSVLTDALVAESERLTAKNIELESHAKEIEKAKQEAQAANEKLTRDFEALKNELAEIKAAQAAAEAAQKFNDRMTAIDETFELDTEERGFIVAEVRDLSDEAFAKWMDKSKKLMKEKTKSFKAEKAAEDKKKKEEMCAALAAKGITVKADIASVDFAEVIASAQANVVSTPVVNTVETQTSLLEKARAEFASSTIGGKKIGELTKK
jgi:hypothetical protein